jgi:flavin-binding protein dodecin
MSVAKTIEITASSKKSFDDAFNRGVAKASQSLDGVTGAWLMDQEAQIEKGKITSYIVRMRITFLLK